MQYMDRLDPPSEGAAFTKWLFALSHRGGPQADDPHLLHPYTQIGQIGVVFKK